MNIHKLYPKIGTDPMNYHKIDVAVNSIAHEINKDQDEYECAANIKTVYYDLSNDEKIVVSGRLRLVKCEGRQLNTLLKDYLSL